MSHDYHETLPGYDPEQILVDGCRECEYRSGLDTRGLASLDAERFTLAWLRAQQWNKASYLPNVSEAEKPLLNVLWAVYLQLERGAVLAELADGALA